MINIYTLYYCDQWRSHQSMDVAFKTANINLLADVIKHITSSQHNYDISFSDNDNPVDIIETVMLQKIPELHLTSEAFEPQDGLFEDYKSIKDINP